MSRRSMPATQWSALAHSVFDYPPHEYDGVCASLSVCVEPLSPAASAPGDVTSHSAASPPPGSASYARPAPNLAAPDLRLLVPRCSPATRRPKAARLPARAGLLSKASTTLVSVSPSPRTGATLMPWRRIRSGRPSTTRSTTWLAPTASCQTQRFHLPRRVAPSRPSQEDIPTDRRQRLAEALRGDL
jgi:hypothetical protein